MLSSNKNIYSHVNIEENLQTHYNLASLQTDGVLKFNYFGGTMQDETDPLNCIANILYRVDSQANILIKDQMIETNQILTKGDIESTAINCGTW